MENINYSLESVKIEPIVSGLNIEMSKKEPNAQIQREWKSCCFSINASATKYFVQVGVLAGLIIYSAVMMVIMPDCNSQRNYSSLLLFCLGILAPSPKMN
jgi:hypothetical protein